MSKPKSVKICPYRWQELHTAINTLFKLLILDEIFIYATLSSDTIKTLQTYLNQNVWQCLVFLKSCIELATVVPTAVMSGARH